MTAKSQFAEKATVRVDKADTDVTDTTPHNIQNYPPYLREKAEKNYSQFFFRPFILFHLRCHLLRQSLVLPNGSVFICCKKTKGGKKEVARKRKASVLMASHQDKCPCQGLLDTYWRSQGRDFFSSACVRSAVLHLRHSPVP